MKSEHDLIEGGTAPGFRLTPKHIRAIEAQIDLMVNDGGHGEVSLVIENHRIARITTTVSELYSDTENGGAHKKSSQSSGSDRSDVSAPWQPNRSAHQKTEKRTRSGR